MAVATEVNETSTEKKTEQVGWIQRLGVPILFTFTAFWGASLLFVVQPLMSKLLLPSFGGSEAVWTTAAFFFQLILLFSYILVHATVRFGAKIQPLMLAPFAIAALFFVPIAMPDGFSGIPDGVAPVWFLIFTLAVIIGLPFTVLAMTGPVISRWYAWTDGVRSKDPYFLFAASNLGSFVGLFSYPFLIEPFMALDAQRMLWTVGFIIFLALMVVCALVTVWRQKIAGRKDEDVAAASAGIFVGGVTWKRRLYWIALAFVPSSLYLGATSFLNTDIAAFPLLWVVPLGLYLISMVVAFGRTDRHSIPKTTYAAVITGVIMLVLTMSNLGLYVLWLSIPLALISLYLIAHAAHVQLAADRPEPKHLTEFFVLVSVGGALGGLFNSVIAPLLFVTTMEYPLVLATSVLMLIALKPRNKNMYLSYFGLMIVVVLGSTYVTFDDSSLHRDRTFYGAYNVLASENADGDREHLFIHGSTLHNSQNMDRPDEPTNYYHEGGSGLGMLMDVFDPQAVTVTGAGAGAVSAYAEEGDDYTFVEIDEAVLDIATNPELFTFFDRAEGNLDLVVGDGRVEARNMEEDSQDLLVLDAFSSISVPTHLLTEDAFEDYDRVLKEDGVIAVNVSNRVLDLVPVVASAADSLGYEGMVHYAPTVNWVIITENEEILDQLREHEDYPGDSDEDGWHELSEVERVQWTDDYSSITDVVDFDRILRSNF